MENVQEPSHFGFWESRTAWSWLKKKLLLEPLPGGARWAAAFGSLLLFAFGIQVITGILLAMNYAPSDKTAWPSVNYIQQEVPLGAFIRSLHHWGSSAMVILLLVHLVQVFVWGAYKRPREITWMVGVLLLFCTLGLAFTGYLLPWDQKAYWATKVGLGIASTVPIIGDSLRTLLQGGPEMGNLTLTRFFTLHGFILPGLVILLVVLHLYLFRLHGVTPGWWKSADRLKAEEEPFWPGQAWKDALLAAVFLGGLAWWCCYRPAPLEAQADPSQPYEARPEWYFMFLFQLLRYFEGPYESLGTFVLPTVLFLILFFWPFLDRNPHRDPRRRPVALTLLGAGTVGLIGLTIFAIKSDVRLHEPAMAVAQTSVAEKAGPLQKVEVARLFNTHCVACHGIEGSGQQIREGMPTIPDFTSLAWQMSQTDLEILHRIVDGNEPLMPAFRDKLTNQQNMALAIYVRAFAMTPTTLARQAGQTEPVLPTPKSSPKEPAPLGQTAEPTKLPATPPKGSPPEPASPIAKAGRPAPALVTAHMSSAQLYRAYCLACHDADGRGNIIRKAMPDIPDFSDAKWQASRNDTDLSHSILEGKGKFMLPMKDKLNVGDAKQMVEPVSAVESKPAIVPPPPQQPAIMPPMPAVAQQPQPAPVSAEQVAERTRAVTVLYRQYCLVCHGIDGRGIDMRPSMPVIPNFTSGSWQQGSGTPQLAVSILDGKGTFMPAFRGKVNPEQVEELVAYVRALGPAPATPAVRAPANDFDKQMRELQEQWETLQKQLQAISPAPPKS